MRSQQKLDRPLNHPLFGHVYVVTGLGFVNVLSLQNHRERRLGSRCGPRTLQSLRKSCKGIVIIVAVEIIRRASLRVTPYAILKHLVPHKTAARAGLGWIAAHFGWIDGVGIIGHQGYRLFCGRGLPGWEPSR